MRKAIHQKWASLTDYSGSSSSTVTPASSSSVTDSYTYTHSSITPSSSSSYATYADYSSDTATRASQTSASTASAKRAASSASASDTASTFSAASGAAAVPKKSSNITNTQKKTLQASNNSDGSERASKNSSGSGNSSSSLISSSDAIAPLPKGTTVQESKAMQREAGKARRTAEHKGKLSAFTNTDTATSTTSNGVTLDDADALVQLPPRGSAGSAGVTTGSAALSSSAASSTVTGSGGAGALVKSFRSLDLPPAPASPYHFSEEELARQPWTMENDAATHTTSEENVQSSSINPHNNGGGGDGGSHGALALRATDVLQTIHTIPIDTPPQPAEAQRRREEGRLPYPSHLTYRIVLNTPDSGVGAGVNGGGDGGRDGKEGQAGKDGTAASKGKNGSDKEDSSGLKGRVRKAVCNTCCGSLSRHQREVAHERAEEREAARQKSYHNQLRSHHVPLVNFQTTRDPHVNLLDSDNVVPTVEEAADYRHYTEDMQGAEANPKKLEKAMRQRRRPASGLHWKTNYAFGRRAGGGPRGVGESAFAREGDPQRFWIAQLHERSQVRLEAIETE